MVDIILSGWLQGSLPSGYRHPLEFEERLSLWREKLESNPALEEDYIAGLELLAQAIDLPRKRIEELQPVLKENNSSLPEEHLEGIYGNSAWKHIVEVLNSREAQEDYKNGFTYRPSKDYQFPDDLRKRDYKRLLRWARLLNPFFLDEQLAREAMGQYGLYRDAAGHTGSMLDAIESNVRKLKGDNAMAVWLPLVSGLCISNAAKQKILFPVVDSIEPLFEGGYRLTSSELFLNELFKVSPYYLGYYKRASELITERGIDLFKEEWQLYRLLLSNVIFLRTSELPERESRHKVWSTLLSPLLLDRIDDTMKVHRQFMEKYPGIFPKWAKGRLYEWASEGAINT